MKGKFLLALLSVSIFGLLFLSLSIISVNAATKARCQDSLSGKFKSLPDIPISVSGPDGAHQYNVSINWAQIDSSQADYAAYLSGGNTLGIKVEDSADSKYNTSVDSPVETDTATYSFPLLPNTPVGRTFNVYVGYLQSGGNLCTFSNVSTFTAAAGSINTGNVTTVGGVCDGITTNCGKNKFGGEQLKCVTDPNKPSNGGVCVPESAGSNYCIKCATGTTFVNGQCQATRNSSPPSYESCSGTVECVQGKGCSKDYTACFYCPSPSHYDSGQNKCIGGDPVSITCASNGSKTCDPLHVKQTCISLNDTYNAAADPNPASCYYAGCDSAQGSITLGCDPKTKTCDTALGTTPTDLAPFISRLFGIILVLAGGIAVLLIIVSGYRLMISQGNQEKIQAARDQLTAAIVGLLFVIFSFLILQVIGHDILNIPGFGK